MAANDTGQRYLSEEIVRRQDKKQSRMMRWGAGLSLLFIMALFGTFIGDDPTETGTMILIILGVVVGLGLIVWAYFVGKEIDTARQYERMFGGDRDGEVTPGELAALSGKTPEQVKKELAKLFSKNFFVGCVLRQTGEPVVLINDAQSKGAGPGFVFVRCESCGGVSRIREGGRGKCQFCGAPIADAAGNGRG